jgi:hypothetical protein
VQLYPKTETWLFTVNWSRKDIKTVTSLWLQMYTGGYKTFPTRFYSDPQKTDLLPNITSSLRLLAVGSDTQESVRLNGLFYGNKADLDTLLAPFLAITPLSTNIRPPSPLVDSHIELGRSMQPTVDAPTETCDGKPHPHKISSGFPIDLTNWSDLMNPLTDAILATPYSPEVRMYVNLQSMRGKIREIPGSGTAFPYRNKPFLIQMQSWWAERTNPLSDSYVQWIAELRINLIVPKGPEQFVNLLEGAFVNFPDVRMGTLDIKTPAGKLELLNYFYGSNIGFLRLIKTQYDPDNLFSFEMSIPPWDLVQCAGTTIITEGSSVQFVFLTNRAGTLSISRLINGAWQGNSSAPITITGQTIPVIAQITSYTFYYPGPDGTYQYVFLLDMDGKLWQLDYYISNLTATLKSLSPIFYSSPDKLDYHLRSFTCAVRLTSQWEMFMIATTGDLWILPYENNSSSGAVKTQTNLPANSTHIASCTNKAGRNIHLLAVDANRRLWYCRTDETKINPLLNFTFTDVLRSLQPIFPGGLPVNGARRVSCSADAQNAAHVVIVDPVNFDLWYFKFQPNGNWSGPIVNIQEEILRSHPGSMRITFLMDVSVSYTVDLNELHVYAVRHDNTVYHTVRNSQLVWSVFGVVPN